MLQNVVALLFVNILICVIHDNLAQSVSMTMNPCVPSLRARIQCHKLIFINLLLRINVSSSCLLAPLQVCILSYKTPYMLCRYMIRVFVRKEDGNFDTRWQFNEVKRKIKLQTKKTQNILFI